MHSLQAVALSRTRRRQLGLLGLMLWLCGGVHPAQAETLQVLAASEATKLLVRPVNDSPEHVRLEGTLADDVGTPLPDRVLHVALPAGLQPAQCGTRRPLAEQRAGAIGVQAQTRTGATGHFCVELLRPGPRASAIIRFAGDDKHEGMTTSVDLIPVIARVELDFGAQPTELALEREAHTLRIAAKPGDPEPRSGLPLQLELSLETANQRQLLATDDATLLGQSAVFTVDSQRLGAPGPARFFINYRGTLEADPSEARLSILKTAKVRLQAAAPALRMPSAQRHELPVDVTSVAGPVPDGWVELSEGGRVIHTAAVREGRATPQLRLVAQRETTLHAQLAYIPQQAGWLPSGPVPLTLTVVPPSPLRLWPWAVACLLLGFVVLRSWWRPRRAPLAEYAAPPEPRADRAVQIVMPGDTRAGWQGRVVDAHEGSPVPRAVIELQSPAFSAVSTLRTATGDDGKFSLPFTPDARSEGHSWRISAAHHVTRVAAVPACGEVLISLVSRRRALIERLVGWATQRGTPWLTTPETTPGHVVALASRQQEHRVQRWAAALEHTAFGPEAVDHEQEAAVRALEP